MPPKRQACIRIACHIGSFTAGAPVAVDDKPAGIELFEINKAGRDTASGQGGRGEADGLWLVGWMGLSGGEPAVKLGER